MTLDQLITNGGKIVLLVTTLAGSYLAWKRGRAIDKELELVKAQREKDKDDRLADAERKLEDCLEGRLTDSQMRRPN